MLITKNGVERNVSDEDAARFIALGFSPVTEAEEAVEAETEKKSNKKKG